MQKYTINFLQGFPTQDEFAFKYYAIINYINYTIILNGSEHFDYFKRLLFNLSKLEISEGYIRIGRFQFEQVFCVSNLNLCKKKILINNAEF